ncbi:NADPH-dependent FMN reductase [Anaerobacterium chartisolvens]|uniref:NADPH-dependent FMN reductase n=1 Tax=Anaerobacterium chartisolvens TaxID=1297424 RepID=A0A369BIV5_9FIRM|nr:NAD(P)H-dependent oxidoreductase [Anaerobacterium chartisolvens]RCX21085.1 NADPH-dependent FMN reductase [Anaerobacterium chartisolvens]
MEVTIIHGQGHKGSTYHASAIIKERICGSDTVIHEYFMPKDTPAFCTGCSQCILKGEGKCAQHDKVSRIEESILRSQVLIIDSPTYCFEMTGQLKTLFDHFAYMWMIHRPRKEMFTKIGIVVSTSAGAGHKSVTKSIARQLSWWGVPKIHRVHFSCNASVWENVPEKIREKIIKRAEVVSQKVKGQLGKVKTGIKTRLLFGIMRRVQKSNNWNVADKGHWQQNGWLGKARPWR